MDNSDFIFDTWYIEYRNGNKKKVDQSYDHFYVLFYEMRQHEIPRDRAIDYLKDSIKKLQPSLKDAKYIYQIAPRRMTEQDFIDSWYKKIESNGFKAFNDVYPLKPIVEKPEIIAKAKIEVPKPSQEDKEESLFENHGGMSKEEYKLQRAHADSYPVYDPLKKTVNGIPIEDWKNGKRSLN